MTLTCYIKENAGRYHDYDIIQLPGGGADLVAHIAPYGWGS